MILSEYFQEGLRAETFVKDGVYGCKFFKYDDGIGEDELIAEEMYPGKAEIWAENCAENYVLGVKKL